ncbi:thioredoxin fold domain-containing protein [Candidatus Falkowbacteria bacterium]|jgi:thioredoxin 2|nr:thioredoxin fold domain-containing protein [Candidatus Falkowbacteria bacterium]MBT7007734.1 thioredoxin fold domain-containing protein [Candidatus Falkowbacteria bacterium]
MSGKVFDLSPNNFEKKVLQSDDPVVVLFWAPWCGPCRMQKPDFEEFGQAYDGDVKFVLLNTDDVNNAAIENGNIPARYEIRSIPAIIIFQQGKELSRTSGYKTVEVLGQFVQETID